MEALRMKYRYIFLLLLIGVAILSWLRYTLNETSTLNNDTSVIQKLRERSENYKRTIETLRNQLANQQQSRASNVDNEIRKQQVLKQTQAHSSNDENVEELHNKQSKHHQSNNYTTIKKQRVIADNMEPLERKGFNGPKLIHLDLKGAPPKIPYLMKLLPLLKKWGATGLLIEYEDMFPYDKTLSVLKSPLVYKPDELKLFLNKCHELDLIVIPLIQTFGHIEFVLKHKKFAHLRHIPNMTNAINPKNPESVALVKTMLNQIFEFHKPHVKYIHIGGDEVWTLAKETDAVGVYMNHMNPIIEYVVSKGYTPIIWDDMLRKWNVERLKAISSKGVQPMLWGYQPYFQGRFSAPMLARFDQAFENIWVASSFKGAETANADYVNINNRVDNHKYWMKVLNDLKEYKMKVSGIALTGWSRYDHDGTLCELLPAALPSLALCLAVLNNGYLSGELIAQTSQELGFTLPTPIDTLFVPRINLPELGGTFPGHSIYRLASKIQKCDSMFDAFDRRFEGWFNERQVTSRPLNVFHFRNCVVRIKSIQTLLNMISKDVRRIFSPFYEDNTIDEWIWDKITLRKQKASRKRQMMADILTKSLEKPV